jgi:hypothetical protein
MFIPTTIHTSESFAMFCDADDDDDGNIVFFVDSLASPTPPASLDVNS